MTNPSATWKAISALVFVGGIIALTPLVNKLLLTGILLTPCSLLFTRIQQSNQFFLRPRGRLSPQEVASHPWVIVGSVLLIWAFGQ